MVGSMLSEYTYDTWTGEETGKVGSATNRPTITNAKTTPTFISALYL